MHLKTVKDDTRTVCVLRLELALDILKQGRIGEQGNQFQ